ncbi:lysylphosphatidylglycerol synthase transmembrane domain-containing protein [Ruminococcus sp.]|uniref:lysylphosphatidylglycerol synthase transmembrane domain-containing protein n=1 Tax=Ruminococcus sp. TaxID=41978 RepID=UPI002586EDED|nr:lysylphosphatidylglycerol synthase transmembrane domain-containing protein [Ruminococcus sp.]MCR5019817.1 flippase-like domain-containing protein [Ruminococcus sp.]
MKYVLNVGFIALIMLLTFRLLFKDQEFSDIIKDLRNADHRWLIAGLGLAFCFVAGESCIIHYLLRVCQQKVKFVRCLKYSFIGFFFSYITPSSSGGQPAQMYYMKKDGVKIGFSTLIMLLVTIAYKSVLVIMGILLLIFNFGAVAEHGSRLVWLLTLGFVLNIAFIAALAFIVARPDWARRAGITILNKLTDWKIVKEKNHEKLVDKINRICDTYVIGSKYVRENAVVVAKVFFMTLLQRLCLFAVTWIVYKSYGLSGVSFIDIVTMQIMIAIAVEMLPLPGAAGVTEGSFLLVFEKIFGRELVKPALLLSRGLTFYAVLIAGGLVTFIAHLKVMRSDKQLNIPPEHR